ncbi:MAG: PilZ domain-containing protein [Deltaproteobacteria bacterium]|nr:PilZ domain-containing protein [Deltaproteobacteria bacterium]
MGLALFKERRFTERRQLSGVLPGSLIRTDGKGAVSCRPVDVSAHGLGIVIIGEKKILPVGLELHLVVSDGEIALTVAWSTPDFGKQDSVRYGLAVTDPAVNLEQVFEKYGCLK